MGSLYKRGGVFWIKYYRRGKAYRESTGTTKKMVAQRHLERREGEIAMGKTPSIHFERVTFEELAKGFIDDYRINERKSLERAEASVKKLSREFEGAKVPEINTTSINAYITKRLEEGAARATINRELAALKRMFSLGSEHTPPKVDRIPHIPTLPEKNVRTGFFEHGEFLALRDALPDYLKGFATFAYKCGWRVDAIKKLTWDRVDRKEWLVHPDPTQAKNKKVGTVALDEELVEVIKGQWALRRKAGNIVPYVFPNRTGDDRIKDFRFAWVKACVQAGLGKRLFHDFRRTAIRNMVRAGIPDNIAMKISGHKTRSIFDRYDIVSNDDLKIAAKKQEAYLDAQMGKAWRKVETLDKMKK